MISEIVLFPFRLTLASIDVVSVGLEIWRGSRESKAYWRGHDDALQHDTLAGDRAG